MYFFIYKTRLKCLYKSPKIWFWFFVFPILLALFYFVGFYKIPGKNNINTIKVGAVYDTSKEEGGENSLADTLLAKLEEAKIKETQKLFSIQKVSEEEAKELLDEGEIAGYIVFNKVPTLYVKNYGEEQAAIKSYLDSYVLGSSILSGSEDKDLTGDGENNIIINDISGLSPYPNNTLVYFYSLVAFVCMLGSKFGFREMCLIQADQSVIGIRIQVSPVRKIKLLLCHMAAAFTLHLVSMLFLLLFLVRVAGIAFGRWLWMSAFVLFLGSLCAMTLGAAICILIKANEKVRDGILNGILLGGWFLSGMVMPGMKYILYENVPLLSFINPFSLITDAFYYLYYYNGYGMFFMNMSILMGLTAFFAFLIYLEGRRREYAGI